MGLGLTLLLGVVALAGESSGNGYVLHDPAHFEAGRAEAMECLRHENGLSSLESFYAGLPQTGVVGTVATQRAYLAFRKLRKYCKAGQFGQLLKSASANGQYNESSPLLGSKAELFRSWLDFSEKHPEVLRFGHALYQEDASCPGKSAEALGPPAIATMISQKDGARARVIAREKLDGYAARFQLTGTTAVAFARGMGLTAVDDSDKPGRDWVVGVMIDPEGLTLEIDRRKYFVPSELIALHELGHIERIMPGEPARKGSTGYDDARFEIGPVLEQIVNTDEVYKSLHKLNFDSEVKYPKAIAGNYANPGLGLIANSFRRLWKKYGSIESGLMSAEGLDFVRKYYKTSCQ